jgi:endoglucanase
VHSTDGVWFGSIILTDGK